MLNSHLEISEEARDRDWDETFFKLLSESNLNILTEDPQQGPDGWPYLITETQTANSGTAGKSDSAQKIIQWLATRGIGLVVNPRKLPYPDYVFSYGMLWSFRETGFFIKFNEIEKANQLVIEENASIKTGPPTKEYLPLYVRSVLKDFFRDQTIFDAKILMISTDGTNYDLCFSLESLGSPPESEHDGILEALAWFLPPHYSLAVISEKGLPDFEPL